MIGKEISDLLPTVFCNREQDSGIFIEKDGIQTSRSGVLHRDEEYDQHGFEILVRMQKEHFWYVGRHRFIHYALEKVIDLYGDESRELSAIDLGGGCGGWVKYLQNCPNPRFSELALGDSSIRALSLARDVVSSTVRRYEVDLLSLPWTNRWHIIFLLDVLEHIVDDISVIQNCKKAMHRNGLLFVTAPALKFFWSYNDQFGQHHRRYSQSDFQKLADVTGLELVEVRYFMFFLSPLLWLSRFFSPNISKLSEVEIHKLMERSHRIPAKPVNGVLRGLFLLETPLGWKYPFPWGTSILGVFRKKQ